MFLIRNGINNKGLESIAREFYFKLNPKKKRTNILKKVALNRKVRKKYEVLVEKRKKEGLSTYEKQKYKFYKYLVQNKFENLKKIILSGPRELKQIKTQIDQQVSLGIYPRFYKQVGADYEGTEFGKEVLALFNYNGCRGGSKFIWWAEQIDTNVCPYCNYENMFIAYCGEEAKLLLDVDHFIPKVVAPYLSLSFYNLLPSCHYCNSRYKLEKNFDIDTHIHPYVDDFHSFQRFYLSKPIINNDPNSFEIILENIQPSNPLSAKSETNKEIFGIIPRYANLKTEVIALQNLYFDYDPIRIEELLNSESGIPKYKSKEELYAHIRRIGQIPVDELEGGRIRCGKLKLDLVSNEFKIFR